MDNYKKIRKKPTSSSGRAIDGFTGGGSSARQVRPGPTTRKSSNANLGNFRNAEGFRPNAQPKINNTTSPGGRNVATKAPLARNPARDNTGKIKLDLPPAKPVKRGRSRKKVILKSLVAVLMIGTILSGLFFGNAFLKARKMFGGGGGAPALGAEVDPSKLKGEGDGRVNILLLGKGGDGHDGADLTDTILIASIYPIQKDMSLLSIPRDFYVSTTDNYKINSVYAKAKSKVLAGKQTSDVKKRAEEAGKAAIESKIEEITGIPIHYYVMVDFAAFEKAVNTVGGVDIDVPKELAVYERWSRNNVLDVKPDRKSTRLNSSH